MVLLISALAFTSVDTAAVAALQDAKACSQRWECGGVIYEDRGAYFYTSPITSKNSNGVDLGPAYALSVHIVADYHTHPCVGNKPLNNFFSPGDIAVNEGLHDVGYMLSLCDGYVRRWAADDAKDDEEIDFHSGRVMYLTRGHIVGMVP